MEIREVCERIVVTEPLQSLTFIERSIIKTYRKEIWSKFIKAIKDFKLIEAGDKGCCWHSGGKDFFEYLRNFSSKNYTNIA